MVSATSKLYLKLALVFVTAIASTSFFTFVFYPKAMDSLNMPLDIDNHGLLGLGLYHNGTLSYYPNPEPTIDRGPVYPFLMAALLSVFGNHYPESVQIFQILLYAVTCLLIYYIGFSLQSDTCGFIAGLICAIHPYIFWFISRIYVETLAIFIFTAIIAALFYFSFLPTYWRALLVGALLALGSLTKATFLPLILIIPLFLVLSPKVIQNYKAKLMYSLTILVSSIVLIMPWSIRNWNLIHHFIPVQVLLGYNLQIGDGFVDLFNHDPDFYKNISTMWNTSYTQTVMPFEKVIFADQHKSVAEKEYELEVVTRNKSLRRYLEHPSFAIEKIGFNLAAFWFLGTSLNKSILLFICQAPLLILFIVKSYKIIRKSFASIQGLHILLIWLYYLSYSIVLAEARFSVVLIPTMLTYGISLFFKEK